MNTVVRIRNTFDDNMAVDAARISFNDRAENHTAERNAKLIDYLVRNKHVNPFFHPMVSLKMPKDDLNTHALLHDRCTVAGISLQNRQYDAYWFVTASVWGLLRLAPYTKRPEYIFSLIGEACPYTMDSYIQHESLGFMGVYDNNYEICNPPYQDEWFSFLFETEMCTKAQLYTHTVGLAKSSQSYRYIEAEKFYVPDQWRGKADNVKQGSSDRIKRQKSYYTGYEDLLYRGVIEYAEGWYDANSHICNEQRRLILPQAQMSKYVITGTREAWERVVKLRDAPHAQKEVRDLMEPIKRALAEEWVR